VTDSLIKMKSSNLLTKYSPQKSYYRLPIINRSLTKFLRKCTTHWWQFFMRSYHVRQTFSDWRRFSEQNLTVYSLIARVCHPRGLLPPLQWSKDSPHSELRSEAHCTRILRLLLLFKRRCWAEIAPLSRIDSQTCRLQSLLNS
jgi:hypothetical protein